MVESKVIDEPHVKCSEVHNMISLNTLRMMPDFGTPVKDSHFSSFYAPSDVTFWTPDP